MEYKDEPEMDQMNRITVELTERLSEEQDAFILEFISPYCQKQTGLRIEKAQLKEIIAKATPAISWGGHCSRCGRDLGRISYRLGFEVSYCPECGQKTKWPEATKEQEEDE